MIEPCVSSRSCSPGGAVEIFHATRTGPTDTFSNIQRDDGLTSLFQFGRISADGLAFYGNVLVVDQTEIAHVERGTRTAAWGPLIADPGLSSPQNERDPATSPDQLSFAVTRQNSTTDFDLVLYSRDATSARWQVRSLDELNTTNIDSAATLDTTALEIILHIDRITGNQLHDLYVAARSSRTDAFSAAAPIVELQTASPETDPWLARGGQLLVFTRDDDLFARTRTIGP